MDSLCDPPVREHSDAGSRVRFWLSAMVLFFVGSTSVDFYANLVNRLDLPRVLGRSDVWIIEKLVVPTRESLYLFALFVLIFPLFPGLLSFARSSFNRRLARQTLLVFVALALLVFACNASTIAPATISPFSQHNGWGYRRIFFPALVYFLHLNGYVLTTLALSGFTFLAIYLTLLWFKTENVDLGTFQYICLLSSGLTIHAFQMPGCRVESVVMVLALLSLLAPVNRAILFVVALSTHETAAVCIFMPLILFVYPKTEIRTCLAILGLYGVFWLLNFGFNLRLAVADQTMIAGKSALAIMGEFPGRAMAGIVFAYKFLWVFVPVAIYLGVRQGNVRRLARDLFAVSLPFCLIPLGLDTSRLIAFGSLGMLSLVMFCWRRLPEGQRRLLLFANLLTPSLDIGLWGVHGSSGIYGLLVRGIDYVVGAILAHGPI